MGTTATVVLITPKGKIVAANVGDSPAYIFNTSGIASQITKNHDAFNEGIFLTYVYISLLPSFFAF